MPASAQNQIFFLYHPPQVDERIAHPAQRRIDAHLGLLGDILEAQPREVAQHHHLALFGGQQLDQRAHVALDLVADHRVLDRALGDDFNVATGEHHSWEEIAAYYKDICNLDAVWVDKEDYLRILSPDPYNMGPRWQLEYARLFTRVTDNSKILAAVGMKQSELMPLYEGLKLEIGRCPKDTVWPVNVAMDEYLAAMDRNGSGR